MSCEFKSGINEYLANAVCPVLGDSGDCNRIHSLSDIIKFNKENPVPENYNQIELEAANATDGIHDPNYVQKRDENQTAAKEIIDHLISKYELDAIVAPTGADSGGTSFYAAVSGYPIITVGIF